MKKQLLVTALFSTALCASSLAQEKPRLPQNQPQTPNQPQNQPGRTAEAVGEKDMSFIQMAGMSGMGEVQMAEMAEKKATDPRVKEIAAMLVKDHREANRQLTAISQRLGVVIPAPGDKENKKMGDIDKKTGADYDEAFLKEVRDHHKKDINRYEEAQKEVTNPELKAYIDKTLPVLRNHAEEVRKALKDK